MGVHALFAPSSAHRVASCPASLLLNLREPDREIIEAAEGTVAHYVAEVCASQDRDPEEFLGQVFNSDLLDDPEEEIVSSKGFDITVDDEMVAGVGAYLEYISPLPGQHFVETRVDISPWCPPVYVRDELGDFIYERGERLTEPQKGTCDHAAAQYRKLIITDLKYGRVRVDAERNEQLVMYALGFINEWDWMYDFQEVVIRIAQPRLDHFDVWVTTKAELLAIGEWLKERFTLALEPKPPFGPSEKACRFCKVLYKCEANRKFLYEHRVMMLDDDDDIEFCDDDELAQLWLRKSMYESRMKAVSNYLHRKIADHEFVPSLKLVGGRKSRYFADEEGAEEYLLECGVAADKLRPPAEMISPNQAEKLLRGQAKKGLSDFIKSKPGKPCLVSIDDKRPALAAQDLELLEDLDADEDDESY